MPTSNNAQTAAQVNTEISTSDLRHSSTPLHLRISREEFDRSLERRRAGLASGTATGKSGDRLKSSAAQFQPPHTPGGLSYPNSFASHDRLLADQQAVGTPPSNPRVSARDQKLARDALAQYNVDLSTIPDAIPAQQIRHKRVPKTPIEKLEKRRMWSGCGIIPHWLRKRLTQAIAACVAVILREIKHTEVCKRHYAYIAKCAGTSKKTVQRAVAIMEQCGFSVQRGKFDGRSNAPTRIVCRIKEVFDWLTRGQSCPSKQKGETYFWRPAADTRENRFEVNPLYGGP